MPSIPIKPPKAKLRPRAIPSLQAPAKPDPPPWREFKLLYQLSQTAQQDAWMNRAPDNPVWVAARLQSRVVRAEHVDQDVWEALLELVWISPNGTALVFIGGAEAFRWQDNRWTYKEGYVPGLWVFAETRTEWFRQNEVKPLRVDRYNISVEDLVELEQIRRYEIQQSLRHVQEKQKIAEAKLSEKDDDLLRRLVIRR